MPSTERWVTRITRVADSEIAYRGVPIADLMEGWSLPAAAWLLIVGRPPSEAQEDALRRSLIAAADHGVAAPSIVAARVCASTRGAPGTAIAAGLNAFAGPAHGGAAQAAAELLVQLAADPGSLREVLAERLRRGERVPGYGHPYHSSDPRVEPLLAVEGLTTTHRDLAGAVEAELERARGRPLRMNADAALAGLLLDAGMVHVHVGLIGSVGRCFGLAAHVAEEQAEETPFRAPSADAIEYVQTDGVAP
jgi:citrate synthase